MGKNVHLITYTDGEVGYRVVKILEYRRIKWPNSPFNVAAAAAAAVVVVLVVFFFLLSLVASVFLAPASSPLAGGP